MLIVEVLVLGLAFVAFLAAAAVENRFQSYQPAWSPRATDLRVMSAAAE